MPLVTLVGEKIAIEGAEFTYLGPINECKECKLKNVCFNLKPGRTYRIKKVREKRHQCKIHSGNVAVVEVEERPILTSIDRKLSKGAIVKIEKKDCKNIGCTYYDLCNRDINTEKKYKILKIHENIECPLGYKLKKAELSDQ